MDILNSKRNVLIVVTRTETRQLQVVWVARHVPAIGIRVVVTCSLQSLLAGNNREVVLLVRSGLRSTTKELQGLCIRIVKHINLAELFIVNGIGCEERTSKLVVFATVVGQSGKLARRRNGIRQRTRRPVIRVVERVVAERMTEVVGVVVGIARGAAAVQIAIGYSFRRSPCCSVRIQSQCIFLMIHDVADGCASFFEYAHWRNEVCQQQVAASTVIHPDVFSITPDVSVGIVLHPEVHLRALRDSAIYRYRQVKDRLSSSRRIICICENQDVSCVVGLHIHAGIATVELEGIRSADQCELVASLLHWGQSIVWCQRVAVSAVALYLHSV